MRLLLSGGGFRATLFHLGVVRYLRETNRLKDIAEVFSISGGSILGAHLTLNWEKYASHDESTFAEVAGEVVAFTQSDLRNRLIRKCFIGWLLALSAILVPLTILTWLLGISVASVVAGFVWLLISIGTVLKLKHRWSRIELLESYYEDFFQNKTLHDLENEEGPTLYILATNFTTGHLAYFTSLGVRPDVEEHAREIGQDQLPVAFAVAASSAFPPLFPPIELSRQRITLVDDKVFPHSNYLGDGGVYDNLGISAARACPATEGMPVLISNAERRFDSTTGETFSLLYTRATRASDILMDRVSQSEISTVPHALIADLRKDYPGKAAFLSEILQRFTRNIRTDLDKFHEVEIQLLVFRGYCAARDAFESTVDAIGGIELSTRGVPMDVAPGHWLPISSSNKNLNLSLSSSPLKYSESLSLFPLDARTPSSYVVAILVIALTILNPLSFLALRAIYLWRPAEVSGLAETVVPVRLSSEQGEAIINQHDWAMGQFHVMIPPEDISEVVNVIAKTDRLGKFNGSRTVAPFSLRFEPPEDSLAASAQAFVVTTNNAFIPIKCTQAGPAFVVNVPTCLADDRILIMFLWCDTDIPPTTVNGVVHESIKVTIP